MAQGNESRKTAVAADMLEQVYPERERADFFVLDLGFDPAEAVARREGEDLLFLLPDGSSAFFQRFFPESGRDAWPAFSLPDGSIVSGQALLAGMKDAGRMESGEEPVLAFFGSLPGGLASTGAALWAAEISFETKRSASLEDGVFCPQNRDAMLAGGDVLPPPGCFASPDRSEGGSILFAAVDASSPSPAALDAEASLGLIAAEAAQPRTPPALDAEASLEPIAAEATQPETSSVCAGPETGNLPAWAADGAVVSSPELLLEDSPGAFALGEGALTVFLTVAAGKGKDVFCLWAEAAQNCADGEYLAKAGAPLALFEEALGTSSEPGTDGALFTDTPGKLPWRDGVNGLDASSPDVFEECVLSIEAGLDEGRIVLGGASGVGSLVLHGGGEADMLTLKAPSAEVFEQWFKPWLASLSEDSLKAMQLERLELCQGEIPGQAVSALGWLREIFGRDECGNELVQTAKLSGIAKEVFPAAEMLAEGALRLDTLVQSESPLESVLPFVGQVTPVHGQRGDVLKGFVLESSVLGESQPEGEGGVDLLVWQIQQLA